MERLRSATVELGLIVGASETAQQWLCRRVMTAAVEEDCSGCSSVEEGLQRREWVGDGDERGGVNWLEESRQLGGVMHGLGGNHSWVL
ncbi:hypothetical protein M0R45_000575 [Rubus argutus]|uniref:Uncharacterized protein n=1 Tax=Rubus argutus TaxID=59490 RepID=A0AAW1VPP9_RUBAR